MKEKAAKMIGDRHLENEARARRRRTLASGVGKAMNAVREIVSKD
jgi:hypothetical protein